MINPKQRQNQHLLWRAGFGPAAGDLLSLQKLQPNELFRLMQKSSAVKPDPILVAESPFDGLVKGIGEVGRMQQPLSDEQKKQIREASRDGIRNLNLRWLDEMIQSPSQLREKMSLFWHGHFATRIINIYFQQDLLDIMRVYALKDFGTLLREVSKSAAMLSFLNNQQNRKQSPNENFAREVMELFTLGRGNYTEKDIKEAARAFTGWGFEANGEFRFREQFHDAGSKTILGKTGNFTGDDVIDILLEQKQTAVFISRKLYRYFVNEKPDERFVKQMAEKFYQSGYDISKLMEFVFTSDHFYEEKNIGNKIKSPVELWVGMRRALPMELQDETSQLLLQRLLGQILFYPPNVAGWPGGKSWIDSSTLMLRMRLPRMLNDEDPTQFQPKTDDDVAMGMGEKEARKSNKKMAGGTGMMKADVDWGKWISSFVTIKKENLPDEMIAALLQSTSFENKSILTSHVQKESREAYIRSNTINLMSLPEYQLC